MALLTATLVEAVGQFDVIETQHAGCTHATLPVRIMRLHGNLTITGKRLQTHKNHNYISDLFQTNPRQTTLIYRTFSK